MFNKIKLFFHNLDAQKVNKWLLVILLIYLFFGMLSYKLIPVGTIYNLFRTNGPLGVATRAVITAILCLYSVLVCYVNRKRFPIEWLAIIVIILGCCFACMMLTNHSYYYYYCEPFFMVPHYAVKIVGTADLMKMYLSTVSDFAIGFCFIFILPFAYHGRKTILTYIYVMCAFMLYQVGYSLVHDAEGYKELLSGIADPYAGTGLAIKGGFSDKEDFGAFLTMGCSLSLIGFALHKKEDKYYAFRQTCMLGCAFIFLIFSIASLCKTAAIACVITVIVFMIYLFIKAFEKSKKALITISCCYTAIIALLLCFFFVPSFHSSGLLNKIYNFVNNYIIQRIGYSLSDRDGLWMTFMSHVGGPQLFFGFGKGGIDAFYYSINPQSKVSIHNGLVYFLGSNGLVAFIFFVVVFLYVFINILKIWKINKGLTMTIIGAICCAFIFSLAERDMVLISSSMKAFSYNVVFTVLCLGIVQTSINKTLISTSRKEVATV